MPEGQKPIIFCFMEETTKKVVTMLQRPDDEWGPPHFGLLICDVVRHVAKAFKVHEDEVWEWVDKERANPSTAITELNKH